MTFPLEILKRTCLTLSLLGLSIHPASAGFQDPKIVLHMVPTGGLPTDCSEAPVSLACNNSGFPEGDQVTALTQGDTLIDYQVYVLLADVDSTIGLRNITFGLSYETGVAVSGWLSCATQAVPSETWPGSGSEITLQFDGPDSCARPMPDPFDGSHFGIVPLAILSVRATRPALLKIIPTQQGIIPITDCSGTVTNLPLDFGLGEIGFGYKIGWDPCNYNPTAHGCGVFVNCVCCLLGGCRPAGEGYFYDTRDCINDGGTVKVTSNCEDCSVPTRTITWGLLKERFR